MKRPTMERKEKAIYLRKRKALAGLNVIETDQGDLLIPETPDFVRSKLKSEGWHMFDEEYYGTEKFDILVLRGKQFLTVHKERFVTFKDDDWWIPSGGALVPPYDWDRYSFVIAWRPSERKGA